MFLPSLRKFQKIGRRVVVFNVNDDALSPEMKRGNVFHRTPRGLNHFRNWMQEREGNEVKISFILINEYRIDDENIQMCEGFIINFSPNIVNPRHT